MKIIIAKAILFNEAGELLLLRRSKTAPRRPLEWDFPGGFVDDGDESYQAACAREIEEETGLSALNDQLHLAYTESQIHHFNDKLTDVSWLYFSGKSNTGTVRLSYEHDDYCWVSLEESLQRIKYDTQLRALRYLQRAQEMKTD